MAITTSVYYLCVVSKHFHARILLQQVCFCSRWIRQSSSRVGDDQKPRARIRFTKLIESFLRLIRQANDQMFRAECIEYRRFIILTYRIRLINFVLFGYGKAIVLIEHHSSDIYFLPIVRSCEGPTERNW